MQQVVCTLRSHDICNERLLHSLYLFNCKRVSCILRPLPTSEKAPRRRRKGKRRSSGQLECARVSLVCRPSPQFCRAWIAKGRQAETDMTKASLQQRELQPASGAVKVPANPSADGTGGHSVQLHGRFSRFTLVEIQYKTQYSSTQLHTRVESAKAPVTLL